MTGPAAAAAVSAPHASVRRAVTAQVMARHGQTRRGVGASVRVPAAVVAIHSAVVGRSRTRAAAAAYGPASAASVSDRRAACRRPSTDDAQGVRAAFGGIVLATRRRHVIPHAFPNVDLTRTRNARLLVEQHLLPFRPPTGRQPTR